ncbi:polysaccharide biosynthesis protein [Candidatus Saccharibacteria bacterium]|nr:polysaccharide biosynthesis protein [Candidatus Saccharibacteria bacterium]
MEKSRTKNTTRNIGAGLVNQIISIVLPFINRTAILWTLGAEFTGLAGLFSSILNVLNIAELGFNTAIVYSLYKPMADKDHQKICEIVSLFRKIYVIVGTVVLVGGLAVMPFLTKLINGSYPDTINLYVVYLLYLINSVTSYYLFAYKECLLIADQRQDVAKNIRTIVNVARYLMQLLVLVVTKDFYLYLIVAIAGTVISNLLIQISTLKHYPFYRDIKTRLKIPADLRKQIGGLVINKICDTFRNSFDSLIISSFIGLTATAIYGNYYYIYSALYGVMLVICNAMSASVGNSIVKNSEEVNYKHMLTFSQIFAGIMGSFTVAMACLYQPFMKVWAGEELLLPTFDMLLFCVYFYVINMNNIRNQYISGNGLWWKLKWSYIAEALANLGLNFVLGKLFGITGVILATIFTIFVFNYLQRNYILFKKYFKHQNIWEFYREQFYYVLLTAIGLGISYFISEGLPVEGILNIAFRVLICLTVPNLIYFVGIKYTKRYRDTHDFMKRIRRIILKRG